MTSTTDDLIAFLNARLDEDEAAALATIGINERVRMRRGTPPPRWVAREGESGVWSEDGILRVRHTWVSERDHIIRHDPARVLRQVEAKRAIVDLVPYDTREDVVRHLAAIYSDHPDYRSEWKP